MSAIVNAVFRGPLGPHMNQLLTRRNPSIYPGYISPLDAEVC